MTSPDFEKLAGQLAEIATSPNFEKTAGNDLSAFLGSDAGRYLIGGVGGAGAGALLGAMQPDREKRRKNMLYYGALGGVGGLGLAHLTNSLGAAAPPPPGSPAAKAQQKAEADTAATDAFNAHITEKGPGFMANQAAGLGAGYIGGRAGGAAATATAASAAAHTKKLQAAQALAAKEMQAGHLATRQNVATAYDNKLTSLGKRHSQALTDADVQARAVQAVTGQPARTVVERLKAQQAAQVARMNKNFGAASSQQAARHLAAEVAHDAKFTGQMGRRARGLGLLRLALKYGLPTGAYAGGTYLPELFNPYTNSPK